MLNKIVQTSNPKPKNEKEVSKKSITIINTVLSNNIELSKHKSHEIYGKYSPTNLSKNNNNNLTLNNNKQKKNNTLANTIKKIIHYSGAKKTESQNNSHNSDKNVKYINDAKSRSKKEYKTLNINDINNNLNINNNNLTENNKNDIKKSKKNNLDKILSESDSCQEIDSMEEESLSKGMKNNSTNLKSSLNYKKHLTTEFNNKKNEIAQKNEKHNSINFTKKKNSGKKKTKKLNINDDNEETDDEIIVNDNEFDNSRFFLNDKLNENKFPKLSSNPFIGQKNNTIIKNEEYRKSISSKEYGIKSKNNITQTISSHHIKSTTLGTLIQSGTNHNSSNLSNIIDLLNINNNNNNTLSTLST